MFGDDDKILFDRLIPFEWWIESEDELSRLSFKEREECKIVSVKGSHGLSTSFQLHNLTDKINKDRELMDMSLLEYKINDSSSTDFYNVKDLYNSKYEFGEEAKSNIFGELLEKVARKTFKYYLSHYSKKGKVVGIFGPEFDKKYKDHHIVKNVDKYILKVHYYPNLIILEDKGYKNGENKFDSLTDIDGFFDYRFRNKQNIIVLESKARNLSVGIDSKKDKKITNKLKNNLFEPLKQLYPRANFYYLVFSNKHSIFESNNPFRVLKPQPIYISNSLKKIGVTTMFMTFNENLEHLHAVEDHLISHYNLLEKKLARFNSKTEITKDEIKIFNKGETPLLVLKKIGPKTYKMS